MTFRCDRRGRSIRAHTERRLGYVFRAAKERDFTETIMTLAGVSLFVIADITNRLTDFLSSDALLGFTLVQITDCDNHGSP